MQTLEAEQAPILFTTTNEETVRDKDGLFVPPDGWAPEALPATGETLNVKVNKWHAYGILDSLMQAYENNEFPYNQDRVRVPHDPRHMPLTLDRGTVGHAMFLFNVCYYMRGGIKSNDAVKRMAGVYDLYPELFDCEKIPEFEQPEIEQILKDHGLGFQKRVAKQWVGNAARMKDRYDGDPRNIFDGVTTYEESLERLKNDKKGGGFIGFQEKMTSMILYYLMDEELIDQFNFPIPVDLHVMRVSIANEMITFPDAKQGTNLFVPETLSALRKLYFDYAQDRHGNALRLCDAVWLLSMSSCGKHPGNMTIEPHGRKHRNGRLTYLLPNVVDVENPIQQRAYEESCRKCPIEKTCENNIPGTIYYVSGNLIIRGRRVRFPIPPEPEPVGNQGTLF